MTRENRRRRPRLRLVRWLWLPGSLILLGCPPQEPPTRVTGGDPAQGRALIRDYGCDACHVVPGVRGATGLVGPPLTHWAHRIYIAGHFPNRPENLIRWIMVPEEIHERTAMPNMGVTEEHARHIAAYLYTLR